MSKAIDERVVSMQFDNKEFESNVSTSLSTIEKLKQSLNFSGAVKGFENINSTIKNVDMDHLADGVSNVTSHFSALEVMGVTALANITNSAVNAGKRLISAFTVDPIKTGLQEYETQINAIQTIMSNTRSKGTTLDEVNNALDELNHYADLTIYNFTEMTRNIGTFTAAGVDLDTSVNSIKGIANLAAVSGSTSQQASTAMYQLSQALAAGTVKLQDWNSVVNAGMGGEVFQNALTRTADVMGLGASKAIETYGTFRESLSKGAWLTSDVLTETLKQISGAYSEAELIQQGYTKEQAREIVALGKDATDAATKVKTFTQLMDTLKEAAQSGWTQTWEYIVGDFDKAKELWTGVSDVMNEFIGKISDRRNNLLKESFLSNWDKLIAQLQDAGVNTEMLTETLSGIIDKSGGGLSKLVKKYGSLEKAVKAGAVSTDDLRAAMDALGVSSLGVGPAVDALIEDITKLGGRDLLLDGFKNLGKSVMGIFNAIADAWYDVFGMTADELYKIVNGFRRFTEFIKLSDRNADNLKRTLRGVFSVIDMVVGIIKIPAKIALGVLSALLKTFNVGVLEMTALIGDAIYGFKTWIFDGKLLGLVIQLITDAIVGGITAIRGWIEAFRNLPAVQNFIEGIADKFEEFKEAGKNIILGLEDGIAEGIKTVPELIIEVGKKLIEAFKNVLGIHSPSTVFFEFGRNIIQGLFNGIIFAMSSLWHLIKAVAIKIYTIFSGINWTNLFTGDGDFASILRVFKTFTVNLATVLKAGLDTALMWIWYFVHSGFKIFSSIDWGKMMTFGISAGVVYFIKKIADVLGALSAPLEGLGDLFSGGEKVLKAFAGTLKGLTFGIKAAAIKNLAISVAILVGSIAALTLLDTDKLKNAMDVFADIAATLTLMVVVVEALAIVANKLNTQTFDVTKLSGTLVGVASAMLIMALAVGTIHAMGGNAIESIMNMIAIMVALELFMAVYARVLSKEEHAEIDKLGGILAKLAGSLIMMSFAMKALGRLNGEDAIKASLFAIGLKIFINAMSKVSQGVRGSTFDGLGKGINKMAKSLLIMALAVKAFTLIKLSELGWGAVVLGAFAGYVKLMSVIAGKDGIKAASNIGKMLVAMSGSMLLMGITFKIMSGIKLGGMLKGVVAITALSIIVAGLSIVASELSNGGAKLTTTLLAMSVAIGILGTIAVMLSLVPLGGLAKGIIAVSLLSACMTGMIWAARGVQGAMKELVVMVTAIGIMTMAVTMLSVIAAKDPAGIAEAVGALGSVMLIFAAMIKMAASLADSGAWKNILAMTAAVAVIAASLYFLQDIQFKNMMTAAIGLGAILAAMVIALKMVGSTGIASAGAMAIVAVGLAALAASLSLLSKVPAETVISALMGLSVAMIAVALASVIMVGAAPGGLVLAAVLLALSAAVVITSAGMLLFANALSVMNAVLPTVGDGFVKLGKGVYSCVTTMASAKDSFGDVASIFATLGKGIITVLVSIAAGMSLVGMAGPVLGVGLLMASAGLVAASVGAIALAGSIFILCAAIAGGMTLIVGAAISLEAFAKKAGVNLVAGFAEGITGSISKVISACTDFVIAVGNTICDLLGIHSPSILAAMWGMFTGEGFSIGLERSTPAATDSATGLVDSVKNVFLSDYLQTSAQEAGSGLADTLTGALGKAKEQVDGLNEGVSIDGFVKMLTQGGSDAGLGFNTSLENTLKPDFIDDMMAGSYDFSSIESVFYEGGSDAGTAFSGSLFDKLDMGSFSDKFGEDFDFSSVTSMFGSGGSDAASEFVSGIQTVDISESVNSALIESERTMASHQSSFSDGGKMLATKIAQGIELDSTKIQSTLKSIMVVGVNSIRNTYSSFYSAGSFLGQGISLGLDSQKERIVAKAQDLAREANKAFTAAEQINSPSKIWTGFGQFMGKGLVRGLDNSTAEVEEAAVGIGVGANRALSKSLSKLTDILSLDIDTQPTIRPVLDLSEVTKGASQIGGMLTGTSVGVSASLGSIGTAMDSRRQNGTTDDVISAINLLRHDLGNVGNTTYNVNGVTYDDGSNITDAVRTLIRAARVERRA